MKEGIYKGLKALILSTEKIEGIVLPEYGGKLASLKSLKTGREFLFQSDSSELKLPTYGAAFSDFDSSGFDEMFPSIDATFYPSGKLRGAVIPDHGEVWAMPWDTKPVNDATISLKVTGRCLPYQLSKKVIFDENTITIDYELFNMNDEPLAFIWAAHALLNCDQKKSKIITPSNLTRVMNVERKSQHLGQWGEVYDYPVAKDIYGEKVDLSRFEAAESGNCEKFYFTDNLTDGWCGVEYSDPKEKLIYEFPVNDVPYLGVWKTHGAYKGHYNFALEPCTGAYDDLYLAEKINRASHVAPGEIYTWFLKIRVE